MRAELLEKGEIKEGVVTIDDLREAAKVREPRSLLLTLLLTRSLRQRGALEIICFNGVRGVFPAYIALEDLQ